MRQSTERDDQIKKLFEIWRLDIFDKQLLYIQLQLLPVKMISIPILWKQFRMKRKNPVGI